jgi:hypothetical protein
MTSRAVASLIVTAASAPETSDVACRDSLICTGYVESPVEDVVGANAIELTVPVTVAALPSGVTRARSPVATVRTCAALNSTVTLLWREPTIRIAGLEELDPVDTASPLLIVTAATRPLIGECSTACDRSAFAVANVARSASMVAWSDAS